MANQGLKECFSIGSNDILGHYVGIVLDHSHNFKIFSKKGAAILLFERENRILKKYDFPLNEKQKKEILNFFNDSGKSREGDK